MPGWVLAQTDPSPWAYHPHPDVWALVLTLAGGYLICTRRFAGRGDVTTTKHKVAWFSGVGLLWVFAEWPIHDLSEDYLFSLHMLQHLVFSMTVAPLLLMGTPPWLLRRLVVRTRVGVVLRKVAKPIPATLLFNTVVVVTHLPAWIDVTVASELAHFVAHVILVVASMIMWLPVVNRIRELPSMSVPGSMLYLFVQSIIPTVPASFLAFATTPLYRAYADAPHPWISAVEDQQLAGAVMKVGGGMFLWGCIIYLFFRWYAKTEQSSRGDTLTWAEVERELANAGPAPREQAAADRGGATPSGR